MRIDYAKARETMVEQQVRPWDVLDPRVLETIASIPREDFVPETLRALAYADTALPLGHGESMMKPVLEGRALQALQPGAEERVLEIGAGSGYLTACLARLARAVTSIDVHADFVERARARLQALGISCARIEQADAMSFAPGRQYDAVAVTGAVAVLPEHFRSWLKPGGRLFCVQGSSPAQEAIALTRNADERFGIESLFETDIPYLRGAAPVARFAL